MLVTPVSEHHLHGLIRGSERYLLSRVSLLDDVHQRGFFDCKAMGLMVLTKPGHDGRQCQTQESANECELHFEFATSYYLLKFG
jgi:hypothetical protein